MTVTSSEEAFDFAENLRQSVQDVKIRHKASVVSDYVSITLGVSSIIPDDALYEAKRKGFNKVIGR